MPVADSERIPTEIPGADDLMEGGILKSRTVLIAGGSGTGKTTMGIQMMYNHAVKRTPAIYVTLEEKPKNLRRDMLRFNVDVEKLEKEGKFTFISGAEAIVGVLSEEKEKLHMGFDTQKMIQKILEVQKRTGAEIACIDSLPALQKYFDDPRDIRKAILEMAYVLSERGLTIVLITSAYEGAASWFGIEDYIADAVFVLSFDEGFGGEGPARKFHIRKMRGTQHSEDRHTLKILPGKGIEIRSPKPV